MKPQSKAKNSLNLFNYGLSLQDQLGFSLRQRLVQLRKGGGLHDLDNGCQFADVNSRYGSIT